MPSRVPIDERFWPKVAFGDGCWEWLGARDDNGYGWIKVTWEASHPRQEKAHRVCWILTRGPIPDGQRVLHTCDNPPCVRPSHLFLGTDLDNRHDAMKKGRWTPTRGERVGTSKLTDEDIIQIRGALSQGVRQSDLALKFGVTQSAISNISRRKRWTHI